MGISYGWDRGRIRCEQHACNGYAAIALSVQLSTGGGREKRVQVRAKSVRLCNSCLDKLTEQLMLTPLRASLADATRKVRQPE